LAEELTLHRPELCHQWWTAYLSTVRAVGVEMVLPRLLAGHLLDIAPYPGDIEEGGGRVVHTGPHLCPPGCHGTPDGCLTALLVQTKLEKLRDRGFKVEAVTPKDDGLCEVTLVPLPW
jgi:hypothetical protein